MVVNLSLCGAAIVTSRLLGYDRTANEQADKMCRPNFPTRVFCVAQILCMADSYVEAAQMLQEQGWFTGLTNLDTALEEECDSLASHALSMNLPVNGLLATKMEMGKVTE